MASVVTSTGLAHYHAKMKTLLNGKANSSHTHDDRYYTETEVNNLLAKKSDYNAFTTFTESTGKPVYIKLFTVNMTSTYGDFVYEFALTRRGYGPAYVALYIQTGNTKYANAISLSYRGLHNDPQNNLKAFHYKDETKGSSTIEVWYKVNAWDELKFYNKTLTPRCSTLKWESTFTTTTAFPTNATKSIDCTRSTFYANLDWGYITGKPSSYTPSAHNHSVILDGNDAKSISICYSKSGLNYADYNWIAAWNGYELRAVNKLQFATASHTHDIMTNAEIDALF